MQIQKGRLSLMAAVASNNVVGVDKKLPWKKEQVPRDMPHFVKQTKKNSKTALIMGRLTFESFGSKPLKGRYNIIVSKTMPAGVQSDGTHVFPNYYDAVEYATSNFEEVFSIGGHDIWLKSLASARRVFLTRIQEPFGGDTVFPFDELTKDFELTYEEDWPAEKDGEISSVMQIWTRKK